MGSARPFIAVVDDEESVRRALVRLLHASQVDVEAFATGTDFLRSLQVRRRRPDCLILDIQMSGVSGRDVQRKLTLTGIDLPVIIITAHDEPTMREQCLADGAAAYLRKPLRANTLLEAIAGALGSRFPDSIR
jgi:FixJ family two-component response regulator